MSEQSYETRLVDETTYHIQRFPPTEGLQVLTSLVKIVGPALARAGKMAEDPNAGGSIMDADVDMGVLGDAIGELVSRLDEDNVVGLVKRVLGHTFAEGSKPVGEQFDHYFMSKGYPHLFKLVWQVLEVNYSDFLQSNGAAAILQRARSGSAPGDEPPSSGPTEEASQERPA